MHRQTVNFWVKRQRALGDDGVRDGRRVSPRRGKGLLTAAPSWGCGVPTAPLGKCRQLRSWIADKSPEQLKLPFALRGQCRRFWS